jgi:acetylornithine deacetylase/succinyl-diaminopimelate desuccinylase-like protein
VGVRVLERLDRLYAIGGGPGANRLGGTREEDEAHELVAGWMREAGLEVAVDGAGNLFGRLRGRRPELPEVWTGSHLDSVPHGGRFDGALGVVGGLEAVELLGQHERTLVVVAFRDEEGCTGPGCRGSRSLCSGRLDRVPAAFVELHVEQGPQLAEADAPLGVVTAIAATARGEVVFEGREGHAGTMPMPLREDALVAAAEFVLRLRDAAAGVDGAVATVGRLAIEPGASNVIPSRVTVSVDVRAPEDERLEQVAAVVPAELRRSRAVAMSAGPSTALLEQLAALGLPTVELPSGAGHDAGVLASAGVPTAMLFVRSLNDGISHSPDEHSADEDVELAVDVLTGALDRLASAVDD